MLTPLLENEHVLVDVMADEPIAIVIRKSTRVEHGDLDRAWGAAERALGAVDRPRSCLLVDVSTAIGRNDEAFEQAFVPYRQRLCAGWLEVALVVRSIPGKLQVHRYARQDEARVTAFDTREAALAALRSTLAGQK